MGLAIDDSLLDEIYASIVVRGDYAGAVGRLSALFNSHSGAVLRRDGDTLQFVRMHNLSPSLMADYNREYHQYDPWLRAEGDRPPCAITIGSRLVSPKIVERTAIYEDILRPHDIWDILNTKVGAPPGPVVYYTFYRPKGRPFSESDALQFQSIVRHLARAHSLREMLNERPASSSPFLDSLGLTAQERRIADLLVEGFSYAALAETVGVTKNTLKWHLRNIFEKSGVRSKAAFITRAFGKLSPGK